VILEAAPRLRSQTSLKKMLEAASPSKPADHPADLPQFGDTGEPVADAALDHHDDALMDQILDELEG